MKLKQLFNVIFLSFFFLFVTFSLAQAQEARKLTDKKWKFDLVEIVKEMNSSALVLDSLTENAGTNSEKAHYQNLRNGLEAMWHFIPHIGSTTFEFKKNGTLVIVWEGKQITRGKWKLEGKTLTLHLSDEIEDVITINKLTDNKLVATTENDSSLRLVSME
ncbi:lipocalin-like domain-containing protein [Thermoflexibacter ruber]|uniref:Lipocalin-like domain-containing protein n=1 Tax=Thermoflexibacter ruber TaxID=1003 RepID=A0A1I2FSU2_9BACT|nr:lipocalin family protein [Thermoflexibacter ruber]SFF08504.1 Lipocalin-like domain-containing protein [Thermoflexibacter ruber]